MRVLVVTHSERTHLLGLVPLAWAFRARGDEVLVATQPALAAQDLAAGLAVEPVGTDNQFWRVARAQGTAGRLPTLGWGRPPTWDFLREELHRVVPWWWRMVNDPMTDDLVALCRRWRPDVVLWGAVTFAGAVAAEACGARSIRVLFGVDLAARLHALYLAARPPGETADPLVEWLTRTASRHGLQVGESVARGHATVDYLPPALRVPSGDHPVLPMQFMPYHGRTVIPDWLRTPPERPRVCVTLGHSSVHNSGHFGVDLREVLTGVADLDVEVVATVPTDLHDDLGPLPPHVRLEHFVPLDALAATCSAVVDHGGAATMCTVARHAVPQVVVPDDTYDEALLGAFLQDAGAGVVLDAARATAATVRDAVEGLLGDAHGAPGPFDLQQQILSMPAPADVVGDLEVLAAGARPELRAS